MVNETWKCHECKREITFNLKGTTWKNNPLGKNCECGGMWEFKKRINKRRNINIWKDIQEMIGIDTDNFEESIHYANFTNKELLKFEKAIKKFANEGGEE